MKILFIIILAGVVIMPFFQPASTAVSDVDSDLMGRIERSPQFKEGKFAGKVDALNMSLASYAATTWDFLFTRNERTPDTKLPSKPVDLRYFNIREKGQFNVTWLGHSSLMINMDGYKILMDPVFEKRVSIFGPTRFNGEVPVDIHHIPPVDAVFISHDHYDHLNKYSVQQLIDKTKKFIVPLAVGTRLVDWGVSPNQIVELDWWEAYSLDEELRFICTPAQHFSGRGVTDRNKTLWASWVIMTLDHRLFFSGDSGYFDGFKKIGDTYGPFDMTFMECGAYDTSWERVHMFPEQTVQAHLDLKGNVLHPIHWATFNLALHSWYDPMVRLTAAAEQHAIQLATPMVGETTIHGNNLPGEKWWEPAMALESNTRQRGQ
jgi:L-ascorbate metabolism protein UlaG (beta-lactamase superfamily)